MTNFIYGYLTISLLLSCHYFYTTEVFGSMDDMFDKIMTVFILLCVTPLLYSLYIFVKICDMWEKYTNEK